MLAVGRHSRLPRRYRGMDIFWWLERIGSLDRTIDEVPDPSAARREPSLQLVGRPDHRTLDLATLQAAGVELAGRLTGVDGHRVELRRRPRRAPSPTADAPDAPGARRDRRATSTPRGLAAEVLDPEPPPTAAVADAAGTGSTCAPRGITHGHLGDRPPPHATRGCSVPVLDAAGEIRQRRGVTPVPGLYVLGQRFQHRRSSNFIDGVGRDAAFVADHLARRDRSALAEPERRPPMHPDRPHYDVVVVGARAAGAATAMLLARAGLRVLVVDRGRYGADTLSTHALMRGGVLQLHRWGLLDRIVAAGTPPDPAHHVPLRRRRRSPSRSSPRHGVDALYAPRRTVLDPVLVDAAVAAGAEVRYGVTVTDVRRDRHGRVTGIDGRDDAGRPIAVDAALVIGADGMRSTDRRAGRRPDRARRHRRQRRRLRLLVRRRRPTATSGSSGPDAAAG